MKRALITIAILALLPAQAFGATWHKTLAEAQAEAKKSNKTILVDMYAEWCGWCKRFEREVYPSERFQAMSKNLVLLKLDTEDGKEGTELAKRWSVTSLPTFVMLTPDLVLAGYLRGYSPADEFVERIQEAEDGYFEFRKRVINEPKDTPDANRLALTNELIGRGDFNEAEKRLRQHVNSTDPAVRDEAYYSLAMVYRMRGMYDDASRTAYKGLEVNGKSEYAERTQLLIAEIYLEQKNYKAALAEYKRFKSQYPNSEMIASVDFIVPQLEAEVARKN